MECPGTCLWPGILFLVLLYGWLRFNVPQSDAASELQLRTWIRLNEQTAPRNSRLVASEIPICDSSKGYLTDSRKNMGAGLSHRERELQFLSITAAYEKRALLDFTPKFALSHVGQRNQCKLYWSDLVDTDHIVLKGTDTCLPVHSSVHCKLNVTSFKNVSPELVDYRPKRVSGNHLFTPKFSNDTAPGCYDVTPTIPWSPFIQRMAKGLLAAIGPNPVMVQMRSGDKRRRIANREQRLTNEQLNRPEFVLKALRRHNVLPPATLYLSTNPGETVPDKLFWEAGYRVVTPDIFQAFKDHGLLTNNIGQFAVEQAAAETQGVWRVITDKHWDIDEEHQINLHLEPVEEDDRVPIVRSASNVVERRRSGASP
ncbi:MAG: uncharacterized protein KVP18_003111 [Porospora cf. gigantea A]|uniref:uncharacterized protein n=1 Tax=Porospora cf. gigantea A TaxID=2853593 RepID=UPI00355A9519|nr:MAG: hypothetical protein KVP18_003111 [Porospora cf. gigantea A]